MDHESRDIEKIIEELRKERSLQNWIKTHAKGIILWIVCILLFLSGLGLWTRDNMLGSGLIALGAFTICVNIFVLRVKATKTTRLAIDIRTRIFEFLLQVVAGFFCEFGTVAIIGKLTENRNVHPSAPVLLVVAFFLTILFGKILEKNHQMTFFSVLDKSMKRIDDEKLERVGRVAIRKMIRSEMTRYYFQSGIVFSVFSSVLVSIAENTSLTSLTYLLLFELIFASLMLSLVILFEAGKIIYPTGYAGGVRGTFLTYSNLYKVTKIDAIAARILRHSFEAWLMATLVIYVLVQLF